MARLILPVAGAAAGFAVGGATGAQWGWMIGGALGSLIPTNTRGPSIDETGAQTTAEGAPRAIVYGTAMVTGNVIDAGKTRKITRKQSQGKGGQSTTTEALLRTYAIRICEGPIAGLIFVKKDDKIVYDARPESNFADDNAKFLAGCRLYLGGEDQLPDPDLEAIRGVGEVPAHRGSVYIVFKDDDVTDRRGSIPQYQFVVARVAHQDPLPRLDGISGNVLTTAGAMIPGESNSYYAMLNAPTLVKLEWRPWAPYGEGIPGVMRVFVDSTQVYQAEFFAGATAVTTQGVQINASGKPLQISVSYLGEPGQYSYSGIMNVIQAEIVTGNLYEPYPSLADAPSVYTPLDAAYGILIRDESLFAAPWGPDYPTGIIGLDTPALLADIISDVHERCGHEPEDFDVTEITDSVNGLVFAQADYTGADAINTLRAPYFFDRAEYEGKICYIKRGKPSVATITFDDLAEEPDDSERQAQIEYPRKLHLTYQSAVVNWESAQATSERVSPDVRVVGESAMQVPAVLSPEDAAHIAAKLHKVAWAEAGGEIKFSLPESFIRLVPSDCIVLNLRGTSRRLRIDNIEHSSGVLSITAHVDRASAYVSTAGYIPLPEPTRPNSGVPGETELAVLDISALRDADDRLVYYAAVTGAQPAWRGALLQRSLDAGATYADVLDMPSPAGMGRLLNTVNPGSPWYTDTTNVIDVEMFREDATIDGITDDQFLGRGGGIAIKHADGTWEIAQYRDALHLGGKQYRLSTLHRGQLNTPSGQHTPGDMLVMLDDVNVVNADSVWLQTVLTHRAPSYGTSPESADPQSMQYVGNAQTEWPMAWVDAQRAGSTLSASCVPRHRFGSDTNPIASINFAGFRWAATDGASTVSQDTSTPQVSMNVSTLASPITLSVSQLNRITGPGQAISIEV